MEIELHQTPKEEIHLQTSRIYFQRILIAMDFSKYSHAALKTSLMLAKHFNSELFLYHSVPPIIYGSGFEPLMPEVLRANLDSANARMQEEIATFPELKSIKHQICITEGPLLETVNDLAKKHSIDLIVAGSHGAHGLEKLILGSTAELLLRQASCPVMILGPHAHRHGEMKSIVLASDLSIDSFRSAQYAAALAEELQGQFTLMNVVEGEMTKDLLQFAMESAAQKLAQLLPADAENWCRPKMRVEHGEVGEQILRVARQEKADLIVLGVHDHSSLADHETWRTLTKVIQASKCPVLTVRKHLHECRHKDG